MQHDTRVVRAELGHRLGGRPQHAHAHLPHAPRITRGHRAHLDVGAEPRSTLGHARRADPRNPDPADRGRPGKACHAACMIVMGVGEHEHVDAPDAVTSECPSERGPVRPGVDEHGAPAILNQDRVPLSDIEDHEPCRTYGGGTHREGECQRHEDGDRPPRAANAPRERPPYPDSCTGEGYRSTESRSRVHGTRRARKPRREMRQPRRGAEHRRRYLHRDPTDRRRHTRDDRTQEPEPEREGHERTGVRVCERRGHRHHAERRRHHRHRHRLRHTRERERRTHRIRVRREAGRGPASGERAEYEQPGDGEGGQLQPHIEDRPGLDHEHGSHCHRKRRKPVPPSAEQLCRACDAEHQERPERRVRHPGHHGVGGACRERREHERPAPKTQRASDERDCTAREREV